MIVVLVVLLVVVQVLVLDLVPVVRLVIVQA